MSDTPQKRHRQPSDAEGGQDEPFLRRWSRRKSEARVQEVTEATTAPAEASPIGRPKEPEKVLTDADMPPVESLNEKSDFSVFMSSGVSEALRRRALRKLFMLPEVNQRCPLDGEWYDGKGYELLGDTITLDMREAMEREALKLKESAMEALNENERARAETGARQAQQESRAAKGEPEAQSTAAANSALDSEPAHQSDEREVARKEKTV